ncbi:MAG: hypothetical protein SNH27_17470, partial [Rikenellaceae bacterium]
NVTVTTADQTFIIPEGVVVNGLTILGGNVEVYGELSGDVARGVGNQDATTTITFKEGSTNSTTSIGDNIIVDKFVIEFEPVANCYMIDINNIPDVLYISLEQAEKGYQVADQITGRSSYEDTYIYNLENCNSYAETVWRTWGAGESDCNITGELISGGEDGNQLGLKVDLTAVKNSITKGHNAVISLVAEGGNGDFGDLLLWSWHLWFTDYVPSTTGTTAQNGKIHQYGGDVFETGGLYEGMGMMDRNLGATITNVTGDITPTSDYEKYYGLYYQYGRKDPFVGYASSSWTTDQDASKMTIYDATGAATDITTQAYNNKYNVSIAIYNPMKYFTGYGLWLYTYASSYDYWAASNDEKSPFDPSPAGWRIPKADAFADFGTAKNSRSSYGGRTYTKNNAYFPISGYIDYTGAMYTASSTYTSFMHNALSNTNGWGGYIEYYSTNVICNDNCYNPFTTLGYTVRCVQDYNYSEE